MFWFPKAGPSCALGLPTTGLCLHCVLLFFLVALSQITAEPGGVCCCFYLFKDVASVKEFSVWVRWFYFVCVSACVLFFFVVASVSVSSFMRVYILSVRETVVGGQRGGEAYFNGLLKEINGLQMAQSIYSNETRSQATSTELRTGIGGHWG